MTPLSKIGHFVECNINGSNVVQTGINVNAGGRGLTLLVIISMQWSGADMTGSRIDMIRCGYNGNNYVVTNISKDPTCLCLTVLYTGLIVVVILLSHQEVPVGMEVLCLFRTNNNRGGN